MFFFSRQPMNEWYFQFLICLKYSNHAQFISIIDAEINLGFSLSDCVAVHVHLPGESLVVLVLSMVLLKLFGEQFLCMKLRQVTTLYR